MAKTSLPLKDKKAIGEILTGILADAVILYTKTRKFHWNVSGPSFMELHKLFEDQYQQLETAIDEIAEKINKMGFSTPGTLAEFLQFGSLSEAPGKYPDQQSMIRELHQDHEKVIATLRKAIDACDEEHHDALTADFLTDLARQHETISWTLRRYLK